MRTVWGPRVNHPDQLLASDNTTLLSDKHDILNRWTEHFSELLNVNTAVNPNITELVPQAPVQQWMDEPPTLNEVSLAVDTTSNGKAPGADGIHPEIIQYGGPMVLEALHKIILTAWETKSVPQDWKDAQIITLFKKGDRHLCSNYRGISLLSIPGKVFARVLLNRLTTLAESILPEAQCGFRSGRGTVDMIFSLKQLQEKCIEQNRPLYMVFVDFTKAFDTVHRETLWEILRKIGCPELFTNLIASLHKDMKASVSLKGELSQPFDVLNGVKQGCVLAPTLFSLFLSSVLSIAFADCEKGVMLQTRPGANLFNVNQFKSSSKTKPLLVRELMFADDIAFVAHSHQDIQDIVTRFTTAAKSYGLQINIKKTELMFQPSPGTSGNCQTVKVDDSDITTVKSFKYLGSTVATDNKLDAELQLRKSKASQSFGRLKERVWFNKDLSLKTKCAVYQAIVLSTLLYGSESWTVYMNQAHNLNSFMMRHLRQILGIKWWHFISNDAILEKTNMPSVHEILIQRNLRWAGHLNRLDNTRLPKQILYSQLKEGKRGIGRPKLRFKDTVRRNLKSKGIPLGSWDRLAQHRTLWRSQIRRRSSSDTIDS